MFEEVEGKAKKMEEESFNAICFQTTFLSFAHFIFEEKNWRKKISLHKSDASFPWAATSEREQFGREDVFVCKYIPP